MLALELDRVKIWVFFKNDNSVDLVTTAQALPWLNLDLFYKEVRRVLKPNGVFAAYGYGINVLQDESANKLIKEVRRYC